MTDRELLEAAAKAAGIEGEWEQHTTIHGRDTSGIFTGASFLWNPLIDDGDALRLAVKLGLNIATAAGPDETASEVYPNASPYDFGCAEKHGDDPYAATRRAVVRAAAAIGEQK